MASVRYEWLGGLPRGEESRIRLDLYSGDHLRDCPAHEASGPTSAPSGAETHWQRHGQEL